MTEAVSRRVTLVEVAKAAGVSPITASRALGGREHVRPEKRDRVLAAAQELGYRRNDNARRLRQGGGSGLIGVAITNIHNPYYADLVLGLDEVAREHDCRLILGITHEDPAAESQLLDDFVGRQVEGLVLVPSGERGHLTPERLKHLPLVLASRSEPGVFADSVQVDDVNGAHAAVAALLARGYRRLAFLGNRHTVSTTRRRLEGFLRAHDEAGVDHDPALVRLGIQTVSEAECAAAGLLAVDPSPDAFFAANNRNAVGLLRALGRARHQGFFDRRQGPGLAVFDEFELAEFVPWPMVMVTHEAREVGLIAGGMLFDRLAGGQAAWTPRARQVPTRLSIWEPR